MPFGAELDDSGAVRFRLWAPAAERVAVEIAGREQRETLLDLEPQQDGWFGLTTRVAGPGSRYRFHIAAQNVRATQAVPDPAARFQPGDVHGLSEVIDPGPLPGERALAGLARYAPGRRR